MKIFFFIVGILILSYFVSSASAQWNEYVEVDTSYEVVDMYDGYDGKYYIYSGKIEIKTEEQNNQWIISHEIAHRFFYRKMSYIQQEEWKKIYKDCFVNFPITDYSFVTFYAKTSEYEDFAETVAMYMEQPDLLVFLARNDENIKKKLLFIENIFDRKLKRNTDIKYCIYGKCKKDEQVYFMR